jgi:soluble lytic murein transglycosylase-like protein
VIPDSTGTNIWPLVELYALENGIPAELLLGCLKAESGLKPDNPRQGTWPDWSQGLSQITVSLASSYGIGDGTPASWSIVKERLADQETAIRIGAHYLSGCLKRAGGDWLQALIAYNSGAPQPEGNWYWKRYAANIANYRSCLAWAHSLLEVS